MASALNVDFDTRLQNMSSGSSKSFSLDSIRKSLIRQEDSIIFGLIERAKFPLNSLLYDESRNKTPHFYGSPLHFFVKESEKLQAKVGRYECTEERPFFCDNLPTSLLPPYIHDQILHPAAGSININKKIWDMYVNHLIPILTSEGDDGNYALTATSDLVCLQALSKRIHYGFYVAEVKYRDAAQDYAPAIRAQDRDALLKLLTFEKVEELVMRRVEKKASIFGQEVSLDGSGGTSKIDPVVVLHMYGEWIMPLTKLVQVEYLLRRLD